MTTRGTYTYRCTHCLAEFDVKRRLTDEDPVSCPKCSRYSVVRLIKPAPVIWKAGGRTRASGSGYN